MGWYEIGQSVFGHVAIDVNGIEFIENVHVHVHADAFSCVSGCCCLKNHMYGEIKNEDHCSHSPKHPNHSRRSGNFTAVSLMLFRRGIRRGWGTAIEMSHSTALDKEISFDMLIRFSLPTIVATICMNIYWSVDGIFVARFIGTDALSAVSIVMPLINFALAIGAMFGAGGNALAAKKLGEGRAEEARQNFTLLNIVAFAGSILLSISGFVLLEPLLRLLGANDAMWNYCWDYAIPILALLPFSICGMATQMSFITIGRAKLGLVLSTLGGLSHVALDYLFIAVLGMGLKGAAIATGIGYSIPAMGGLLYFLFSRDGALYLIRPNFDFRAVWQSCTNGASEMVTSFSASVAAILLNNILIRMAGADGVAAASIILYVQGLLSAAYIGYSTGISPIISYSYGKAEPMRLKKIYSISLWTIFTVSVVSFAASLIFAGPLVGVFVKEGAPVYDMAVRGYRMFSISFLFMGFNVFSSAMFTALNNGRVSAILSFFRTLVFTVAAIAALPAVLGVSGVWLARPLAEILAVCMTAYYFRKMKSVYRYA